MAIAAKSGVVDSFCKGASAAEGVIRGLALDAQVLGKAGNWVTDSKNASTTVAHAAVVRAAIGGNWQGARGAKARAWAWVRAWGSKGGRRRARGPAGG